FTCRHHHCHSAARTVVWSRAGRQRHCKIAGICAVNLRDLDLNLLVVFRAIWQDRNVSTAAQHLDVSQSAASNALRRLRKRFGDPLFLPTSAGMVPTPLASQLAEPINTALETLNAGLELKRS